MAILADQHMHSSFSFDSEAPLKDMVESAIRKGLNHINITEHNDFDFPVSEEFPEGCWDLNVDSYLYDLLRLREAYKDKITIGFGMEIGLREDSFRKNAVLTRNHDFDFIVGSVHLVRDIDTYDDRFYEGRSAKEAFNEYFDTVIANIKKFQNFDVLGHLDYLTRRVPGGESAYNPMDYADKIDEILDILLENEKGLELNTQTLGKGLEYPNPWPQVLKRYKEKGGEIITVGSDAHKPEDIAVGFDKAATILADCGFKYYTVFKDRTATYLRF